MSIQSQMPPEDAYGPTTHEIYDITTGVIQRAIKDTAQAREVLERMIKDNLYRTRKAAQIMTRYNDAAPYNQKKLESTGEGWRRNSSTGFFSGLVKRGMAPYHQAIEQSRVLTNSTLEVDNEDNWRKSQIFQKTTTTRIRSWKGFQSFKSKLITENFIFGYGSSVYTDPISLWPEMGRQDTCIFPEGTSEDVEELVMFGYLKNMKIHEMASVLKNPEESELAGWNLENVAKSINEARPLDRYGRTNDKLRMYEDILRESNTAASFSSGVKEIEMGSVFAVEADGKVSQFLFRRKDGLELAVWFDRYEKITDCVTLFSIDTGNGNLHGSKGAGRMLYNTSLNAEQARNLISDNLYLSGLLMMEKSAATTKKPLEVIHPVCIVGPDFKIIKNELNANVDAFVTLDRFMTQTAELQLGGLMPGQQLNTQGTQRSASEINYIASVETQITDSLLTRFLQQFLGFVSAFQRRAYNAENVMKAWKMFQEGTYLSPLKAKVIAMLETYDDKNESANPVYCKVDDAITDCYHLMTEGLTPEDILELANAEPGEVTPDFYQLFTEGMGQASVAFRGNPAVDQQKLLRYSLAGMVGWEKADELIIPTPDQTIQAEASRMQLGEDLLIFGGKIPLVSPRDNHKIHLDTMMQDGMQTVQQMLSMPSADPNMLKQAMTIATNYLGHAKSHVQMALQAGMKPKELAMEIDMLLKSEALIGHINPSAIPPLPPKTPSNAQIEQLGLTVPPPKKGHEEEPNLMPPAKEHKADESLFDKTPMEAAKKKPLSHGPQTMYKTTIS